MGENTDIMNEYFMRAFENTRLKHEGIHANCAMAYNLFSCSEEAFNPLKDLIEKFEARLEQYYKNLRLINDLVFSNVKPDAKSIFKQKIPIKDDLVKLLKKIFSNYTDDSFYFEDFPKYFKYFIFPCEADHKTIMKSIYDKNKDVFLKLATIELLSPDFVHFISKNFEVKGEFIGSTNHYDSSKSVEQFRENIKKYSKKCPSHIADLFQIDGDALYEIFAKLVNQYPKLFNLIYYYIDKEGFECNMDQLLTQECSDIKQKLTDGEAICIPKDSLKYFEQTSTTSQPETVLLSSNEEFRSFLKELPTLPKIKSCPRNFTLQNYFQLGINMAPVQKRKELQSKLNGFLGLRDYEFMGKEINSDIFDKIDGLLTKVNENFKLKHAKEMNEIYQLRNILNKFSDRYDECIKQNYGYYLYLSNKNTRKQEIKLNIKESDLNQYANEMFKEVIADFNKHLEFIKKDYSKEFRGFLERYYAEDLLYQREMLKSMAINACDMMYGSERKDKPEEIRKSLLWSEKWQHRKDRLCTDLSYDLDPLQKKVIFEKFSKKLIIICRSSADLRDPLVYGTLACFSPPRFISNFEFVRSKYPDFSFLYNYFASSDYNAGNLYCPMEYMNYN